MQATQAISKRDTMKSMLFLASSFILAYCLQITVHELGHYFAGLLVGAEGGKIFLHPFLNSKVVFQSVPSVPSQVFIGMMGVVTDILLATTFAFLAWRKTNVFTLPLVMWGSIAFIGEGIGMLGNIAALPYSFDDVGQLMLLDISPKPLIPLSIVFVIIGLIMMILIMPISGISPKDSFLKKLIAFFCCLPLYFTLAILYLRVFDPQNMDILDVRMKQFIIGLVFAILLAICYKPMNKLLGRIIKTKDVFQPKWSDIMSAFVGCTLVFTSLIMCSYLFN
ncbi:MAG: hypothetical protein WA997_18835 [Anaerolineales bacterium]